MAAHPGWASVRDYHELHIGERLVIHGHSHGRGKPLPRQADVGVDAWDFRPIEFEAIAERIGARPKILRS